MEAGKAPADGLADGLAIDLAAHAAVLDAARAHREHPGNNQGGAPPDVNAAGPYGSTPLLAACLHGRLADIKLLLDFGSDPALEGYVPSKYYPGTKYRCFPLLLLIREGHVAVVELLLTSYSSADAGARRIDVNQATSTDWATPLYMACQEGHSEVVTLLLAFEEIAVNKGTDDGTTPLFMACQEAHTEVVTLLLAHARIDPNKATTDDGVTPLYIACDRGHVAVVKLLLAQAGIDVNKACPTDGMTPLYAACNRNRTEVVKLLLAYGGIDVNQASTDGYAPIHIACDRGYYDTVRVLLTDGRAEIATPDSRTGHRLTPLHTVAFDGRLLPAQLLVVYGASLTAGNVYSQTHAEFAAAEEQGVLAEWLNAVAGWPRLRVAAGCRLHKDAAFLLRRGKIDPDTQAAASIATSKSKPAALPWPQSRQRHIKLW